VSSIPGWKAVAALFLALALSVPAACSDAVAPANGPSPTPGATPGPVQLYSYKILNRYPHDRDAFTQGLVFDRGALFEGTGLNGRSSLRRVDLESGKVLQAHQLSPDYFGEGITVFRDRIIQLTWQSRLGFVYNRDSFQALRTFNYSTEGWGLTHDGKHLILSDGTDTLFFLDPETFAVVRQVRVRDNGAPVTRLNELEYAGGRVYANVWQTDRVAIIDPADGRLSGWIDLSGLLRAEDRVKPVDVLNGIASRGESGRLFVTGKLWPWLFEIEAGSGEEIKNQR